MKTIALTAGASAPECLVEETVKFLERKGFSNVQELEVMPENVRFGLPPEIVEAIAAAPASSHRGLTEPKKLVGVILSAAVFQAERRISACIALGSSELA